MLPPAGRKSRNLASTNVENKAFLAKSIQYNAFGAPVRNFIKLHFGLAKLMRYVAASLVTDTQTHTEQVQ